MVLVTSAFGRVGHAVTSELIKRGFTVRATDINPKAEELISEGAAEVLVGDARDRSFMMRCMEGVDQVAYVPPCMVYDEDEMAILAIDCALEAGAGQFVQLSVCHPGLSVLLQHTKKLIAEEHLKLTGFQHDWNFTILQPLHYTTNVPVRSVVETGKYENFKPLDRKLGYVDLRDVAEAAAIVLSEGEKHKFATYELCGPSYLSIREIAELLEKLSGRKIETIWRDRAHMFDGAFYNFCGSAHDSYARAAVLGIRDTYNEYGFAANKNVLEWLLGRPARSMEDYIRDELAITD